MINKNNPVIPTGFKNIDQKIGGLNRGVLHILGTRPAQGKTAFGLNVIYKTCCHGENNILLFSLEMPKESIYKRLYAMQEKLVPSNIRNSGKEISWDNLNIKSHLFINDKPGITITEIISYAKEVITELENKKQSLDLIVVDYLNLIRAVAPSKSRLQQLRPVEVFENRKKAVENILKHLRRFAKDVNIPILLLAQLSRNDKTLEPSLSDLREFSDTALSDLDSIWMIHREEESQREDTSLKNEATLIVHRSINGVTGKIGLEFNPETVSFEDK